MPSTRFSSCACSPNPNSEVQDTDTRHCQLQCRVLKLECAVEQGAEKGSTVSERKVYRRGEIRHDQPTPAQPSRVMREITSRTNLHLKFPANMVCRMPQIRGSQQIPDVVLLQDSLFLSFFVSNVGCGPHGPATRVSERRNRACRDVHVTSISHSAKRLAGFKWSRKAMSAGLAGGAYFRTIFWDVML